MLSHRTGAQLLGLGPLQWPPQWHTARRIFIEIGSKMHGTQPLRGCLQGCYGACRGGLMQHTGYKLPRISVPRTWVNKGPGIQKSSALMSATQLSSLCLGGHPPHGSVTNWPRNARAEG